jgi:hypothetical protein
MSEKFGVVGRYNRVSPSSGRGSIIAYSPLPKSEQECANAPGNNCLAIPLSAIQDGSNIYDKLPAAKQPDKNPIYDKAMQKDANAKTNGKLAKY